MKYLFIFIVSIFSAYITAEQLSETGIEVVGKALVKAEPDQFVFTVSINQRGPIASKTKALVDHKSHLVTDMYLSMGIAKNMIESARLQLIPRYEKPRYDPEFEVHQKLSSQGGSKGKFKAVINSNQRVKESIYEQEKIYFEVLRTITVTFTDVILYYQLLDNLVKIGVSRISPLKTSMTNHETLYQQALIKALQNASQKAKVIAKKTNVKLGQLSSFKELSYHTPSAYIMARRPSDGFSAEVGQKDVSAMVSVTFAIKDDK